MDQRHQKLEDAQMFQFQSGKKLHRSCYSCFEDTTPPVTGGLKICSQNVASFRHLPACLLACLLISTMSRDTAFLISFNRKAQQDIELPFY
ncbi:hypothetical protein T4D_13657 [Trichinella pseudospiralis]|uniref:Uncharacterized protein n=1 Tax=Trichinella pseudospiralis TaxID=6337 RepID=A0A0V1FU36_TRIPS|nr:hypothetical protein T4D_13657 [Trichinella pseudospiralis]